MVYGIIIVMFHLSMIPFPRTTLLLHTVADDMLPGDGVVWRGMPGGVVNVGGRWALSVGGSCHHWRVFS